MCVWKGGVREGGLVGRVCDGRWEGGSVGKGCGRRTVGRVESVVGKSLAALLESWKGEEWLWINPRSENLPRSGEQLLLANTQSCATWEGRR